MIAGWESKYRESLEVLLKAGADMEAGDEDGWTPLLWAGWDSGTPEASE